MLRYVCPPPVPLLRTAPAEGVQESLVKRTLLRVFGFYSKETMMMRGAQGLYDGIKEAVDDKRLMEGEPCPPSPPHLVFLCFMA